jgi:hypothetical protein
LSRSAHADRRRRRLVGRSQIAVYRHNVSMELLKRAVEILGVPANALASWLTCEPALRVVAAPAERVDATVSSQFGDPPVVSIAAPSVEPREGLTAEEEERVRWTVRGLEERGAKLRRLLETLYATRRWHLSTEPSSGKPPRMSSFDLGWALGIAESNVQRLVKGKRIATQAGELDLGELVSFEPEVSVKIVCIEQERTTQGRRALAEADDGRVYVLYVREDMKARACVAGDRLVLDDEIEHKGLDVVIEQAYVVTTAAAQARPALKQKARTTKPRAARPSNPRSKHKRATPRTPKKRKAFSRSKTHG